MARDNPAIGSSKYVTVKSGQGWLEVAADVAKDKPVSEVAAALAKKYRSMKKPRPGMVVQAPADPLIGQTQNPGLYQPNQPLSLFNRPGLMGPTLQTSASFQMPQQPGPYQLNAPAWAQNYQKKAEYRKGTTGNVTPAPAPSWAPNYQALAQWRKTTMPAPQMPPGFNPTPTQLPDTWQQSYPRTAEAIGAQIESGYYPLTISALDAYTLQLPDEILTQAGYQKQPHGGWARMGPDRLDVSPSTGRYAYGSYGGRGYRSGGGGGGSGKAPRATSGGGYGRGGYSTSGRMLDAVGNGLISWRI